jgi:hypothetical protein
VFSSSQNVEQHIQEIHEPLLAILEPEKGKFNEGEKQSILS